MRVLKAIGAAILATASILGGIGSFAQWAGIEFTGVVGVVVGAAPAWLPIASLLFGILIGWNAKKWQESKRLKARDEEVSELQNQVAELEKRPTQEQLDAALAEKDAVIEEQERRHCETLLINRKETDKYIAEKQAKFEASLAEKQAQLDAALSAGSKEQEAMDAMRRKMNGFSKSKAKAILNL